MMSHSCKISVCIPVFNPGPFLKDAIDSVLAQSFVDFELVIVDDASTQPVGATVARYNDPRVRFERNSRNLGLVSNWNRCLTLARGAYITIFHQDDLMLEENLAAKVALLDAYKGVGLVHSNIETIDVAGTVTGGHWAARPSTALITPGLLCYQELALHGNFISCPSVMARAECYEPLGGFDARLPLTCDMEMWMRIASSHDVGYLATPLIANRVHNDQATQRFSGSGREIHEVQKALHIAFSRHALAGISSKLKRQAHLNLAAWAWRMGYWRLGQGCWRDASGYFLAGLGALSSLPLL
jgi:glycosyltransferase involved in cell wall biosynthesis